MMTILKPMIAAGLAAAWIGAGACAAASAQPAPAQAAPQSAEQAYLDQLVGDWDMIGDVRGSPAHYRVEARRVLDGAWIAFHIVDAAAPPRYEAMIMFGADAHAHDFVVHWLDRFGGAGARVTGLGTRDGQTLNLVFPYADGAFRNAWTFDAAARRWTVSIEGQEPDGSWRHFARYQISPR